MKIIIPMAGMGKRLRPFTLTTAKPLIKIAGKSIVQRLVETIISVSDEKVTDVAFILGDFPLSVNADLTKVAENLGFKAHFVYQKEALGTAHAIYQAKFLLKDKVIVAFADTLFDASFKISSEKDVVIWTKKVENPENYGVVVKNSNDLITAFYEKPKNFISDEAIIGIYYFKEGDLLLSKLEMMMNEKIIVNGEYQLTDALQMLLDDKLQFASQSVDEWLDCGNKDLVLNTMSYVVNNFIEKSNFVNSGNNVIIEPVYIGQNVEINNSVIGPNVCVEDNSIVKNSIIKDTILLENVQVENANLSTSILGNNSKLTQKSLNIAAGDFDEINI